MQNNAKLFSKFVVQIDSPKTSVKEFSLFHISDHIWIGPAF